MSEQVMISRELLGRILNCMESDWMKIDMEWGPSEGGLDGEIEKGLYPEIKELRAYVQAIPPPASAQHAGEVPEVVAYGSSQGLGPVLPIGRLGSSGAPMSCYDLPLMTVAQHICIVAALQARAVVLPSVDQVMRIVLDFQDNKRKNVTGTTNWAANLGMAVIDEVARLNAAPVQQPKCKTCDDNGRIGGPSFYAPDEGGEPCPDCSAPAQQVSVPDGWRIERRELDGSVCFIIGSPRLLGVRANTSVWESDSDPAHLLLWHMLAAAPAAPAADAGVVDMYRHLQTVTPYRFKKIQDASVTDGGDVLYFHKDRFDAALLDDMAANCAKESK